MTKSVVDSKQLGGFSCNGQAILPKHIDRFDSQHEFKVYLELVRMYGFTRVIKQYSLQIIRPSYCYPHGKNWKVDFAIRSKQNRYKIVCFVEAKGAFLSEFGYTLSALETYDRESFRQLRIVFSASVPKKNRIVANLLKTDYRDNLFTLKQLKKLTSLP